MKPLPLLRCCWLTMAAIMLFPGTPAPAQTPGIPLEFPKKKLIAMGWDSPEPDELLKHLSSIEALPFDGVRVNVPGQTDEGQKIDFRRLLRGEPWKREWFQEGVETLGKVRSSRLTENFLSTGSGSTIDWFDDEAWKHAVDHFRIAAWVAKEGGLRGIIFDPEVGVRQPAFSYNRQPQAGQYSFEAYAAKVRQRGREVMKAVAEEYPDMVFFFLFLNGGQAHHPFHRQGGPGENIANWYLENGEARPAGPANPMEVQQQVAPLERIEGGSYNLLPAFLNGLLDVIPPEMSMIDGLEQTYTTTERPGFINWAHSVHTTALSMVAPENRRKYRAQVEAGFGIYIDPYVNPPGSKYFIGPSETGENRVQRFGNSVRHAMETTDRYIWLWGEQYRWWPTSAKRVRPESWEEAAPGITDALKYARNPSLKSIEELLHAREALLNIVNSSETNLVSNGDFEHGTAEGWGPGDPSSVLHVDETVRGERVDALRVGGTPSGIAEWAVPVPKGSGIYGIRAKVAREGGGKGEIRVRWRKNDGPFLLATSDSITLTPPADVAEGRWVPLEGVVAVPGNQTRLVLQCIATPGENGKVWFDEIEVYRLDNR